MQECVWCRAVLSIQSIRRMLPVRRRFLRQRRAAVSLQAGERGRSARKDFKVLKQRHRAAIKVQVGPLSISAAISLHLTACNCFRLHHEEIDLRPL